MFVQFHKRKNGQRTPSYRKNPSSAINITMKLLIVIDMQNDFIDGALGTKAGVGGSSLSKKTEEITLLDVYKAVSEEEDTDRSVFNFYSNPNSKCPVGSKIHAVLDQPLDNAQKALEEELKKTTIKDLMGKL